MRTIDISAEIARVQEAAKARVQELRALRQEARVLQADAARVADGKAAKIADSDYNQRLYALREGLCQGDSAIRLGDVRDLDCVEIR